MNRTQPRPEGVDITMPDAISSSSIRWAIGAVILTLVVRFVAQVYWHRRLMHGRPGPAHSWIWGSLPVMGKVMAKMPRRVAPQALPLMVKDEYNLGDYFFLDPFPMGDPIMVVLNTDMMHDVTVKRSLPKHPEVDKFMKHLGGPGNLVSSEGAEWKKWRAAFNPGFSLAHLTTLVPVIVDECSTFCDLMTINAKNNTLFRMEQATTRLTIDIIGKVVLDTSFGSQHGPNELVDSFAKQVRWQRIGAAFAPWELVDFRRPFAQAYYTWKMDRYIGKELDKRFESRRTRGKSKAVVDLALEAYMKEVKGHSGDDLDNITTLDPEFKKAAIANMKTFIFAGHDTTSGTICYAYYYLSRDPAALAKIRDELDTVFGTCSPSESAANVAAQLKADPKLLNKLTYTLAVTRETLRLQPPASTVRMGQKDVSIRDPATGEQIPTEHMMIWPVDVGMHRSTKYWDEPHTFQPARFLAETDTTANFASNPAWIAFSKGTRNCIGQELAMLETKVILAMTLRAWRFDAAYADLALLKGDGSGYPSDVDGVQLLFGEEAYQIQLGTAKPREGMPCRLALRG
ncbi:cytochrome P450 [Acrodontium crateriforme]|uniref:Cytochrome P450 n=1 Tax=Acrodontium crateriforme TaxID=150365 RepID=A0AAQ3RA67_9PEZI|nr:cytochrome P450 [Acrodontium crateriforme]